jgi:xylan 1,4-beta-xylosidase
MQFRARALSLAALVAALSTVRAAAQTSARVEIIVSSEVTLGPLAPIWSWFGYDEPNYTYTPNGQKLLSALATASPVPVYVRTHNLLTTGDGSAALKWGSTNAYTEDAAGNPVYDWTIVDRIVDTYVARGMKPLMEIGFMPEALSSSSEPYRHHFGKGVDLAALHLGWAYPPKDYDKWRELVSQWVHHSVSRYGQKEVESWWWELWNEPDNLYWRGTPEEFMKLYDYTADGVKRALPTARIGGPHVTNPSGARSQQFLRAFLEHALRGTNYATGKVGAPLDYIGFHAKGSPTVMPDGHVRMNVSNQLRAIASGFEIVASYPELKHTPIVIGESDPEGCAACPISMNPANAYRNGTMYSSYTAEQIARTYQLADAAGVNLLGSVTWAFEFEDQPYFAGFRDLATNGIDKPVLNVFRMLGQMRGRRVAVTSSGALPLDSVRNASVRAAADVSALAARDARSVSVLLWNYHDDDLAAPAAELQLTITGLPVEQATLTHYRVDRDVGNSYEAWKTMGAPQQPTAAQYAELERAGQLALLLPATSVHVSNGRFVLPFRLPRQGVSLVQLVW